MIFVLAILAILTIYYIAFRKDSTIWSNDASFSIKHPEELTHITIRNENYATDLLKLNGLWKINGSDAWQARVNYLLAVSGQLEIISPVSRSIQDSIIRLMKKGTYVSLFNGHQEISSFIICRFNNYYYAKHERSSSIYCISIKGNAGTDLLNIFNPEESNWYLNKLFDFHPDEIVSIQLTYPQQSARDFKIEKIKHSFLLSEHDTSIKSEIRDTSLLGEYIQFYSGIQYEKKDSYDIFTATEITAKNSFFHLVIKGNKGVLNDIKGYKKFRIDSTNEDLNKFYAFDKKKVL